MRSRLIRALLIGLLVVAGATAALFVWRLPARLTALTAARVRQHTGWILEMDHMRWHSLTSWVAPSATITHPSRPDRAWHCRNVVIHIPWWAQLTQQPIVVRASGLVDAPQPIHWDARMRVLEQGQGAGFETYLDIAEMPVTNLHALWPHAWLSWIHAGSISASGSLRWQPSVPANISAQVRIEGARVTHPTQQYGLAGTLHGRIQIQYDASTRQWTNYAGAYQILHGTINTPVGAFDEIASTITHSQEELRIQETTGSYRQTAYALTGHVTQLRATPQLSLTLTGPALRATFDGRLTQDTLTIDRLAMTHADGSLTLAGDIHALDTRPMGRLTGDGAVQFPHVLAHQAATAPLASLLRGTLPFHLDIEGPVNTPDAWRVNITARTAPLTFANTPIQLQQSDLTWAAAHATYQLHLTAAPLLERVTQIPALTNVLSGYTGTGVLPLTAIISGTWPAATTPTATVTFAPTDLQVNHTDIHLQTGHAAWHNGQLDIELDGEALLDWATLATWPHLTPFMRAAPPITGALPCTGSVRGAWPGSWSAWQAQLVCGSGDMAVDGLATHVARARITLQRGAPHLDITFTSDVPASRLMRWERLPERLRATHWTGIVPLTITAQGPLLSWWQDSAGTMRLAESTARMNDVTLHGAATTVTWQQGRWSLAPTTWSIGGGTLTLAGDICYPVERCACQATVTIDAMPIEPFARLGTPPGKHIATGNLTTAWSVAAPRCHPDALRGTGRVHVTGGELTTAPFIDKLFWSLLGQLAERMGHADLRRARITDVNGIWSLADGRLSTEDTELTTYFAGTPVPIQLTGWISLDQRLDLAVDYRIPKLVSEQMVDRPPVFQDAARVLGWLHNMRTLVGRRRITGTLQEPVTHFEWFPKR